MEAKRAERRLSGKTVPAATRAAQSVCVCIEPPSLGIKACCQRLLSYYLLSAICLVGRSHQLTEVMGNGQRGERGACVADFLVSAGQRVGFTLTWHPSHEP